MEEKDSEIIFRPYKSGDEEQIVPLLEEVFKEWPDRDIPCTKVDFWKWKYLDSPYNVNTISVAEIDDKIIGCYHAQHYYINFHGESFFTRAGTDVATHPDYRGMGLFNKMLEVHNLLEDGLKTRLNVAVHVNPILIERVKRKISEFNDRIFFNRIYEITYINDINLHLNNTSKSDDLKKYIGFYTLKNISKISNIMHSNTDLNKKLNIIHINKFNDDVNDLLDSNNRHLVFNVVKDKAYLNWRYCDKRAGNYIVKAAYVDEQLLGYYVLKINKLKEYHTGNIVDLLVHNEHPYLLDALVHDVLMEIHENDVNVVRQWVIRNSIMEKTFQQNGFIDTRSGVPVLVVRKIDQNINLEELFESPPDKIHFQMGDTEWM